MPLSTGVISPRASIRLVFDKDVYQPGETVTFRVVVDPPPPVAGGEVFTGAVAVGGEPARPVSGTALVAEPVLCGAFTSDRYDISRDPADPLRFVATPKEAAP